MTGPQKTKLFILMKKFTIIVAFTITGLAGAFLFIHLFGAMTAKMDGASLRLAIQPALPGTTVLDFGPLGSISARTHAAPMLLTIQVEQLDPEVLVNKLTSSKERGQIQAELKNSLPDFMMKFGLRQVAAGALGAFLAVFIVFRPRRLRVPITVAAGTTCILLIWGLWAAATYRLEAFQEPQYRGILTAAPSLIALADESIEGLGKMKEHTGSIVASIRSLTSNLEGMTVLAEQKEHDNTRTILIISDLHSNPIGIQLVRDIAERFQVDLIIDAGDLTDLGTDMENQMVQGIKQLGKPHIFVSGNHDTRETVNFLKAIPGTTVLTGQPVLIQGVRIVGWPDPGSLQSNGAPGETRAATKEELEQIKDQLEAGPIPDLLVMHNPSTARQLAGRARVIVCGHTHRLALERWGDSIYVNPGTTGAAGIRGLYSAKEMVYSAVILRYQPDEGPVSADLIKYDPMSREFSLERRMLTADKAGSALQ